MRRFSLQAAARDLLPREGVARCQRTPYVDERGRQEVSVLYSPAARAGHYGGLYICKSVWHCPVCAAKISERRREDLAQGLANWSTSPAGEVRRVLLVTFTLQHNAGDSLDEVFTALKRARRLLVSGRGGAELKERYGVVGMVRSLEITYGDNGWHPHLHVLMFFNREVAIIPFEVAMKARWQECVSAAGRYANWTNGCDVRFSDEDISGYIAKFGREPAWTPAHEMTKGVTKVARRGGSTPLQLLSDYLMGDERAGRLWLQYAVVLKGERQLRWSNGLRKLLGLDKEKTDEELAIEEEQDAVLLASLSVGAWRLVLANDARGELLGIASTGDAEQLEAFLGQLGWSGYGQRKRT